jgi:hypothetical protein
VHERDHDHGSKPAEPAAERSAPARVAPALELQRKIGNRAFGRLVARRSPEESVELLEPAILGAHKDAEQISRTFLPFSSDQESFDKMAEAYETKTETPLQQALETQLAPEDLAEVNKRVPWRGFPPPKEEGAGGGGA